LEPSLFANIPYATILVGYVALLFSLSVHEASHATVAYLLKDDTAARRGRMTLNPIAHIDILGTVILPLLGMVTGARVIGWAKPVPVDPSRLTHRFRARVGYALVAGAGPVSNLLQSLLFLVILCLFVRLASAGDPNLKLDFVFRTMMEPVETFLKSEQFSPGQVMLLTLLGRLVIINVGLAVFNLLPFGPLDGAGILRGFLPFGWLPTFDRIQPAMSIMILLLFLVGVMGYILLPFFWVAETFYLVPMARLLLGA
jgi:Zn-dependent protease